MIRYSTLRHSSCVKSLGIEAEGKHMGNPRKKLDHTRQTAGEEYSTMGNGVVVGKRGEKKLSA